MNYIESFIQATKKDNLLSNNSFLIESNEILFHTIGQYKLPESLAFFYSKIKHLKVQIKDRFVEILPPQDLVFYNFRYLIFSHMNEHVICFDTSSLNSAKEWNIVNPKNDFLITMTMSSFLTNKIWAWVKGGREVWDLEIYK